MEPEYVEKQKCTSCKCWRELQDYVGKRGNPVKQCITCRERDAKQKQKPEIKEKALVRQRDKKYYVEYRNKKREEDEEAYLQHNAEMIKKWRDKKAEQNAK